MGALDGDDHRLLAGPVVAFFGVLLELRTYRSLLYLLLAFPLGVAYFALLASLLSTIVEAVPFTLVLAPLVLLAVHGLAWVERGLVVYVLGVDVHTDDQPLSWLRSAVRDPPDVRTFAHGVGALVVAPRTWTRSLLVAAKFPVGVLVFTVLVVLAAVTGSMVAAPLLYDLPGVRLSMVRPVGSVVVPAAEQAGVSVGATPTLALSGTTTEVETLPGAVATSAGGLLLVVAALHVLNGAATVSAWATRALLRCERPAWR